MKSIVEYLDDLKEKTGSDYMTAKKLGMSKVSISCIRSRGQMSDDTAIKMADLLGVDRTEVLIAATIARSHGEVKQSWEKISKMSGIAAGLAIFGVINLANSSIENELPSIHYMAQSVYYVKFMVSAF